MRRLSNFDGEIYWRRGDKEDDVFDLHSPAIGAISRKYRVNERAGIAQSVQLLTMGWTAGVRFPSGVRDFSILYSVQIGSGVHPASYPIFTRGSSPEVNLPGREADHSPPASDEVKNGGAILPLLNTSL
jgi:hypothetical protein